MQSSEAGRCPAIVQKLVPEDSCTARQHEKGGQLFRVAVSSAQAVLAERAPGHRWEGEALQGR